MISYRNMTDGGLILVPENIKTTVTTKNQKEDTSVKIINFEEAKARKRSREKTAKHFPDTDSGTLELEQQYREYAQFCNQWYDEHVVG